MLMRTWVVLAVIGQCISGSLAADAETPQLWPQVTLSIPRDVALNGALGDSLRRGIARLGEEPYDVAWLLADVSFEVNRIFTNYSGDASGRFLELAALTSSVGKQSPATLAPFMAAVPRYQKPDGHFGVNVDLAKPLTSGAPPIPMLWGNARILVGLLTCAREYGDPRLLASAKRLGDFYVATAEQLCDPRREAEFRATGTAGDGYTCCYFPAIEGLTMLYTATKDERYLRQAQRMAEMFRKFDALPIDHSHGNLCAWRGILQLYQITGDRKYLDRARAKWDAAVKGGFVWTTGGVGEHWHVSFGLDEGCSESDWLRVCLELWRFTGETRYLDMAERLLYNQYATNQCSNGGYGSRHFDGNATGPTLATGSVEEWNYCCSFHGPLGLHFLKSYLAAGSARGVMVNFPLDFTALVKSGARDWRVAVHANPDCRDGETTAEVELTPAERRDDWRTTLWLHMPEWASGMTRASLAGKAITPPIENGYLRIEGDFHAGVKAIVTFRTRLALEGRRFQNFVPQAGKTTCFRDVSLIAGPWVLSGACKQWSEPLTVVATIDAEGRLALPGRDAHGCLSVALPGPDVKESQLVGAIDSAAVSRLRPLAQSPDFRTVFVCNVVVVPVDSPAAAALETRLKKLGGEATVP
jgi:hypothetical protein